MSPPFPLSISLSSPSPLPRCDAFGFSKPVSADEAKHVEDLYLSDEFGRDKEKLTHFLTESGTVLRRKAGDKPPREMVVALLRKMNTESDRVLAFLASLDTMFDAAPKAAELQRTDVARYLTSYDYDEANATELMKTIWKLANPKPPKPPPKGSKKPPQPYYSEMCGEHGPLPRRLPEFTAHSIAHPSAASHIPCQ